MKAIKADEDGTTVTVGENYLPGMVDNPLEQPIVYLELDDDRDTAAVGLTRDEALDLIDGILAVLESYGVAPSA